MVPNIPKESQVARCDESTSPRTEYTERHRIRGNKAVHQQQHMAEQIGRGYESQNRREENESGKNGQDEIVGERRGHLQCVMPHHIPIGSSQGPLDATEIHCS